MAVTSSVEAAENASASSPTQRWCSTCGAYT
jgi:hypothetical protein